MKLKIISEGTPTTTSIVNAETGEFVENISELVLRINVDEPLAMAQITFLMPTAEVSCDFNEVEKIMD